MRGPLLALLIAIATGFAAAGHAKDDVTFKFCYVDVAQPPYFTGESTEVPAQHPGATIELLRQLESALPEMKIEYQRAPQRRCLYNLELGLIDGVIAAYTKELTLISEFPQRQGQVDTERVLNHSNSHCLVQAKESSESWDGSNFHGEWRLPIAVRRGDNIGEFLQSKGVRVQDVPNHEKAMQLVQNKRVSGAALHCESATQLLDRSGDAFDSIAVRHPPLRINNDYLVISTRFYRQHPELSEQIWSELARLRDEVYERLYFSYMGRSW